MSISLDQTPGAPLSTKKERPSTARWLSICFWGALGLIIVAAVFMRLYHLDLPFDRDSYDEGVYWQSLRSMRGGLSLYHTVFYSQPPLFLLSTYAGYALFGSSLWSARLGVALVSLLGFLGAYLLGKALAGRRGALVVMLLLLVDPFYLAQSQTIQAEASSVAFTMLAIAFAFLWWKQPEGRVGACWAALCGLTFALSLLCKLLCISTLVPLAWMMLVRAWQIVRKEPGTSRRSWWPMLAGIGTMLLVLLLGVLPFLRSWSDFWADVWTFHSVASKVATVPHLDNLLRALIPFFSLTALAALYGLLMALLRRDWRVLPLLAWLLVTFIALFLQQPLFIHHLIALEPPLIALAVLGLAVPASYKVALQRFTTRGKRLTCLLSIMGVVLILAACVGSTWQDVSYYQGADANAASALNQQHLRVASDLRKAIGPDQWVVTDGQFIAGLANRDTPPQLVDTSSVRLLTGFVTLSQLEQISLNPRVHAVLFYTGRLAVIPSTDYYTWVTEHFHLYKRYDAGQELWVR